MPLNLLCCPWLFPQITGNALKLDVVPVAEAVPLGDPVLTIAVNVSWQAWSSAVSIVFAGGAMSKDSKSKRKSQTARKWLYCLNSNFINSKL